MDDFLDKFQNIRKGFLGNMRFLFILDLILISAIFYSISIILNFKFLLGKLLVALPVPIDILLLTIAFIIGMLGAFLLHRKDAKINVLVLIENKYSGLKEKLRTAYDNREETNIIVDSLKNQVSEAMSAVSASKLLSGSMILSKFIITIIFLSAAFMIASDPQQYQIPENTMKNLTEILTGPDDNGTIIGATDAPTDLDKTNFRGGGDIFGKPRIASIEGKNIDLSLYSGSGTGSTVVDTSQPQNQFIKSAAFPVDILGSVSDDYNSLMKRSEAEKQLINKYAVERSRI